VLSVVKVRPHSPRVSFYILGHHQKNFNQTM